MLPAQVPVEVCPPLFVHVLRDLAEAWLATSIEVTASISTAVAIIPTVSFVVIHSSTVT